MILCQLAHILSVIPIISELDILSYMIFHYTCGSSLGVDHDKSYSHIRNLKLSWEIFLFVKIFNVHHNRKNIIHYLRKGGRREIKKYNIYFGRWWHTHSRGRGRWIPENLRPAWSTRATSRTVSEAAENRSWKNKWKKEIQYLESMKVLLMSDSREVLKVR